MARGRIIVSDITKDKRVNDLSDDTSRLAFTWLVTFADREGRTHGDPAIVRSMVFPRRDDISVDQMRQYIAEWAACGLVTWYEAEGDHWIAFPSFEKHQTGFDQRHEPQSIVPEPPQAMPVREPEIVRTSHVQCTAEVNRKEEKRSEEKGATRKRAEPPPPAIVAFREAAGGKLLPRKATWATIVKAIPDTEPALQKWRDVVAAWMCTPYSPQNINGMLDWYRDGIPERMKGHSNGRQSTDGPSQPPEWCSRTNAGLADGSLRVVETFGQ